MAKITKVPDGPLVKKKGPFKGSTLKAGGKVKKAQNGESFTKDDKGYTYTKQVTKPEGKRTYQGKSIDQATAMKIANFKSRVTPSDSLRTVTPKMKKNGGPIKKAQNGKTWQSMSQPEKASKVAELKQKGGFENVKRYKDSISADSENRRNTAFAKGAERHGLTVEEYAKKVKSDDKVKFVEPIGGYKMKETKSANTDRPSLLSRLNPLGDKARCIYTNNRGKAETKANGGKVKKAKAGAMIKRADGSTSQRGLWDNIRANKGSGKKPTAAMLKQEKKIKAKK